MNIPVLMYHRVCKKGETTPSPFVVEVDAFERQLAYFARHGYHTPSLGEVLSRRNNALGKPLLITFDDGYLDTLELAIPLLARYGFSAVVFLVADFSRRNNWWDLPKGIPEARLMEKDHVLELKRLGVEIGSHSWSHPSLPTLSDAELAYEFTESRKAVEDLLQQPVHYFAYPYGETDERVKAAARRAGYHCAFSTNSGALSFYADLHQIRRTIICNRADSLYLYAKLSGIEKSLRVGWSVAKKVLRRKPRYSSVLS
jgi:peptidoglycan/xylan/chitin deacetylase (PgdA/CDA1 family)